MHLTVTQITPTQEVYANLGEAIFAEAYSHDAFYYLDLWNQVLIRRNSGYSITYNPRMARARLYRNDNNNTIFVIPCDNPRRVKGYYIVFRLLHDDVLSCYEFLCNNEERSVFTEAVNALAEGHTPPADIVIDNDTGAVVGRTIRETRHRRHRRKHCGCVVM